MSQRTPGRGPRPSGERRSGYGEFGQGLGTWTQSRSRGLSRRPAGRQQRRGGQHPRDLVCRSLRAQDAQRPHFRLGLETEGGIRRAGRRRRQGQVLAGGGRDLLFNRSEVEPDRLELPDRGSRPGSIPSSGRDLRVRPPRNSRSAAGDAALQSLGRVRGVGEPGEPGQPQVRQDRRRGRKTGCCGRCLLNGAGLGCGSERQVHGLSQGTLSERFRPTQAGNAGCWKLGRRLQVRNLDGSREPGRGPTGIEETDGGQPDRVGTRGRVGIHRGAGQKLRRGGGAYTMLRGAGRRERHCQVIAQAGRRRLFNRFALQAGRVQLPERGMLAGDVPTGACGLQLQPLREGRPMPAQRLGIDSHRLSGREPDTWREVKFGRP